jgi:hypothetical protein
MRLSRDCDDTDKAWSLTRYSTSPDVNEESCSQTDEDDRIDGGESRSKHEGRNVRLEVCG